MDSITCVSSLLSVFVSSEKPSQQVFLRLGPNGSDLPEKTKEKKISLKICYFSEWAELFKSFKKKKFDLKEMGKK